MSFCATQPSPKKILRNRKQAPKTPITTTMPLRTPCTESQHAQVMSLLKLAVPVKTIGSLVNPPIAYTTVLKMRRNLHLYHNTHAPKIIKIGRTLKINSQMSTVSIFLYL